MADILPEEEMLKRAYEYEPVSQKFSADLDKDEELISLTITVYEENAGIIIDNSVPMFHGEYTNSFEFGAERLLYRRGDQYSHFETWEDIDQPNLTDVYKWMAPTKPKTYTYVLELVYRVNDTTTGGGKSKSNTQPTGGLTITKSYTQDVYPNWDRYSKKLRDQLDIRRKTWLA